MCAIGVAVNEVLGACWREVHLGLSDAHVGAFSVAKVAYELLEVALCKFVEGEVDLSRSKVSLRYKYENLIR